MTLQIVTAVSSSDDSMIPKIIHFTLPPSPTSVQLEMISITREKHPGWEIKVWQDPVDPDGFRLSQLWPHANSGAQRADLIRLDVVAKYGGVYLDSDVRLLKPLDPFVENYEFFVASEDGDLATNAIFGATPGHPALSALIESLIAAPPDWNAPPNETTGPAFFSRVLQWRSDVTMLPRETFYPYNWNQAPVAPDGQTYAVHEWAGSWKQHKHDGATLGVANRWMRFTPRNIARRLYESARELRQTNEAMIRARPRILGYSASGTLVRKTVHDHFILLSGSDISITPEMMAHGYYELREELFLKRILTGGDFFIDVGANVGAYTLLAAGAVGRFGRVFAYEPNPAVADLIRKSAVMNWMHDRIVVRPKAVGSERGSSKLVFAESQLGGASLGETHDTGSTSEIARNFVSETREIDVDIVSLDDEFPADIPIRALKIDAEGFEVEVFAGAHRLISSACVDFIMLEAIPEVAGSSWSSLVSTISRVIDLGYEVWKFEYNGRIAPTSLRDIQFSRTGASRNILLRRKGARI